MPAKKTKKTQTMDNQPNKPEKVSPEIIQKKPEKPRMTAGFIILLIFFGISLISTIIGLISGQAAQKGMFLGFMYGETAGLLMSIITIIILGILIYGIIKRISWTRDLALVYYGLMALNALVSVIVYFANKDYITNFLISNIPAETIPEGVSLQSQAPMIGLWFVIETIISLLVMLIILVFYYKKKKYFTE